MSLTTRVYNPRGQRTDGGGLIAQVILSPEEVDAWCQPSALARSRFARAFDRITYTLRREVEAALSAEWDRRLAAEQERVSMAVDAHDDVPPGAGVEGAGVRQPVDSQSDGTSTADLPPQAASTPTT